MPGSYIYILGSQTGTLYIGVTNNLYLRVMQHKEGTVEGFTATYGCKRLLYFEGYEDIRRAIACEKQLKGWRREKKLNLIRTINPEFNDLAQAWGWKMIAVHEGMYPWSSGAYHSRSCLGLRWSEGSKQHGQDKHHRGSFGYAQDRLFDSALQALRDTINL
jgi:putative endonuclease